MAKPVADKPLVLLSGELKTPPLSREARREFGFLLRKLQQGLQLEMPHSRPMPSIGRRCSELRVNDANQTWRLLYRADPDAVLVAGMFSKKTGKTPKWAIEQAKRLLKEYDAD